MTGAEGIENQTSRARIQHLNHSATRFTQTRTDASGLLFISGYILGSMKDERKVGIGRAMCISCHTYGASRFELTQQIESISRHDRSKVLYGLYRRRDSGQYEKVPGYRFTEPKSELKGVVFSTKYTSIWEPIYLIEFLVNGTRILQYPAAGGFFNSHGIVLFTNVSTCTTGFFS